MKKSTKLMEKVKRKFPHVYVDKHLPFRRVYGLPDGVKLSWSNGGIGDSHIYSYDTMATLLKADNLGIRWCNGLGMTLRGWEVFLVDHKC